MTTQDSGFNLNVPTQLSVSALDVKPFIQRVLELALKKKVIQFQFAFVVFKENLEVGLRLPRPKPN